MSCLICNSQNQELIFKGIKDLEYNTYKAVDYQVCKSCGLISQYPLPEANLVPTFYPDTYRNYLLNGKSFFSSLKNIQFKNLANKILEYFNRDNKDLKILDIGFGNGQLLLALKEKGYKNLYGTDFTDKVFSKLNSSGIKLKVSNIEEEFPFNESFDVIIMNNVIEHFLDPTTVLKNCLKYLKKEGRIVLITPNSNALELSVFKKYWAGFHAPRHIFLFNTNNIKLLGKNLGFSKITVVPECDPGQISISIQNIFQDSKIMQLKLRNGMAWYLMPLSIFCSPIAIFQNWIRKSTSMICVLFNN